MVDFMLNEACMKTCSSSFQCPPIDILSNVRNACMSYHDANITRHAKASLSSLLLAIVLSNDWIYQYSGWNRQHSRGSLFITKKFKYNDAQPHADLGGCQANTASFAHRFEHVIDKYLQLVGREGVNLCRYLSKQGSRRRQERSFHKISPNN